MDPVVKQMAVEWQKCKHLHTHFSKWCFISWQRHLRWSGRPASALYPEKYQSLPWPLVCVCVCVCVCARALSHQSCPSLCNPMDYSPPGSSVHGILQTRILEWVAMSSSGWSCRTRNWTCVPRIFCIAGGFFTAQLQGKPPWSPSHIHFPGKPKSHIACI